MKKLMIMAVAAMFAVTAFAQNPEALKQIKKCKSYSEAESLIKQNESSLSAAEKAQAYNKLVDILMPEIAQDKVNEAGYADKLTDAINAALACAKFDAQPNDKGKVAPKFTKANAERLFSISYNLINAGNGGWTSQDYAKAEKYWATFSDACFTLFKDNLEAAEANIKAQAKLMAKSENKTEEEYLKEHSAKAQAFEVCGFGARAAYQNKDKETALRLASYMMDDPAAAKDGMDLYAGIAVSNLNSKQDSLECVKSLEALYEKHPENGELFTQLGSMYGSLGMNDKQAQFITDRIAKYPDSFGAWALKGQNEMNDKKYDEAIADFKKAAECTVSDPKQKALALFYIGYCYQSKAAAAEKEADQKKLVGEAIPYLEQARQIDPKHEFANWGYTLYNCYYFLYGEQDSRTAALKAELGY